MTDFLVKVVLKHLHNCFCFSCDTSLDVNECLNGSLDLCPDDQSCVNLPGGFDCQCRVGSVMSPQGMCTFIARTSIPVVTSSTVSVTPSLLVRPQQNEVVIVLGGLSVRTVRMLCKEQAQY